MYGSGLMVVGLGCDDEFVKFELVDFMLDAFGCSD